MRGNSILNHRALGEGWSEGARSERARGEGTGVGRVKIERSYHCKNKRSVLCPELFRAGRVLGHIDGQTDRRTDCTLLLDFFCYFIFCCLFSPFIIIF